MKSLCNFQFKNAMHGEPDLYIFLEILIFKCHTSGFIVIYYTVDKSMLIVS